MTTADVQTASLRELAEHSSAWPFEEARKIVARLKKARKDEVIFETGYGPSGLPHIGTFGEVARTTMVRHAFRVLTDDKVKTRLIAFSDDMDGLRKVPDNVPNRELLGRHLGKPLTRVPDPFGTHESFGAHNNARLRAFLDAFGFDYEFLSSTDCYTSGRFDAALMRVLERFEKVMAIMLPSLREERAATYSPFLPIDPDTGIVLQVPVIAHDAQAGTITYEHPDTKAPVTTPVTGGRAKLQWKPDWAMRWVALGVDYEMAGKDLIDSVKLSGEICRALGATPPEGFNYELFLDERGQKISKSKGNGLTIDEWLRYASPESLSLFMYREPKAAKRLYFDVIPRNVDEYQQFLEGYQRQDDRQRLTNPVWHIHAGNPPAPDMPISFGMLLTLVSSSNAENAETLWGFVRRYRPGVTPQTHPKLNELVEYAIHYFRDFVLPEKRYREPSDAERAALTDLRDALSQLPVDATAEAIQDVVYEIGRREPFLDKTGKIKTKDGKPGVALDWFNMLYQVLLGQEKGPRFGSFVAVYGVQNTVDMIDGALARSAPAPKPKPKLLAPLVTEKDKHRLHDRLAQLLVLTTSLSLAVRVFSGGSFEWQTDTSIGMMCNAFDLKIHFPVIGPIEAALKNVRLERIEMAVEEMPPRDSPTGTPNQIIKIFDLAAVPVFIDFFETHRPWVEDHMGKIDAWPDTFAFGRVIRNAMSHGGRLKMTDKKAKPVTWKHLRYDVTNDGKPVYGLGCDLWVSDVVLLMFDMSEELDKAGCPIDPT